MDISTKIAESFARRDLQPFESRVTLTYLVGLSMDALLKRVTSVPAHSARATKDTSNGTNNQSMTSDPR